MSFLTALYAAIKAVPIIDSWVRSFYDLYVQREISQIQQGNATISEQKMVLAKQIRLTKDPHEKAVILTTYNNL